MFLFSLSTFLYIPIFTSVCIVLMLRKIKVTISGKESKMSFPQNSSLSHNTHVSTVNTQSSMAFPTLLPLPFESWNCKIWIRCSAFSIIKCWAATQRVELRYHWYIWLFCLFHNVSNIYTIHNFNLSVLPVDCSHKNIPLLLSPFILTHLFLVSSTFRCLNIHLNIFLTYFFTMPRYYSRPAIIDLFIYLVIEL